MTATTKSLLAVCVTAFVTTSLHAEDSIFQVSAFIAGIDGSGFVGNQETQVGETWDFTPGQDTSFFVHSADDTPVQFEDFATSPLGGSTYGRGECLVEITETGVDLLITTLGFVDGGDAGEYASAYSQVHGEFHVWLSEPAMLDYQWCNNSTGDGSWSKLYLRKLVNGNFQTVDNLVTSPNSGQECDEQAIEVEAGVYQLWYSTYVFMNNSSGGNSTWALSSTQSLASLRFTPLSNIADINGDGIVDGADLALILSAWGTSDSEADLNGDGIVDGADLALVLANWS